MAMRIRTLHVVAILGLVAALLLPLATGEGTIGAQNDETPTATRQRDRPQDPGRNRNEQAAQGQAQGQGETPADEAVTPARPQRFPAAIQINGEDFVFDRVDPEAPTDLIELGQQGDLTLFAESAAPPFDRVYVSAQTRPQPLGRYVPEGSQAAEEAASDVGGVAQTDTPSAGLPATDPTGGTPTDAALTPDAAPSVVDAAATAPVDVGATREPAATEDAGIEPEGTVTPAAGAGDFPLEVALDDARFSLDRPVPVDTEALTEIGTDRGLALLATEGAGPFDRVYGAEAGGDGQAGRYLAQLPLDESGTPSAEASCLAESGNFAPLVLGEVEYAYAGLELDLSTAELETVTQTGDGQPIYAEAGAQPFPELFFGDDGALNRFVLLDEDGVPTNLGQTIAFGGQTFAFEGNVTDDVDATTLDRLGCVGPFPARAEEGVAAGSLERLYVILNDQPQRVLAFAATTPTADGDGTPVGGAAMTEEPQAATTETAVPTETPLPPTATTAPTGTPVPPTETVAPTETPPPPTETPEPTETPIPTPEATETPLPTLEPTAAATPTETAVPATETPAPTDVPTETPPPTETAVPATETVAATETPLSPTETAEATPETAGADAETETPATEAAPATTETQTTEATTETEAQTPEATTETETPTEVAAEASPAAELEPTPPTDAPVSPTPLPTVEPPAEPVSSIPVDAAPPVPADFPREIEVQGIRYFFDLEVDLDPQSLIQVDTLQTTGASFGIFASQDPQASGGRRGFIAQTLRGPFVQIYAVAAARVVARYVPEAPITPAGTIDLGQPCSSEAGGQSFAYTFEGQEFQYAYASTEVNVSIETLRTTTTAILGQVPTLDGGGELFVRGGAVGFAEVFLSDGGELQRFTALNAAGFPSTLNNLVFAESRFEFRAEVSVSVSQAGLQRVGCAGAFPIFAPAPQAAAQAPLATCYTVIDNRVYEFNSTTIVEAPVSVNSFTVVNNVTNVNNVTVNVVPPPAGVVQITLQAPRAQPLPTPLPNVRVQPLPGQTGQTPVPTAATGVVAQVPVLPRQCQGDPGQIGDNGVPERLPARIQLSGIAYSFVGAEDAGGDVRLTRIGCVGPFEADQAEGIDVRQVIFLRDGRAADTLYRFEASSSFEVTFTVTGDPQVVVTGDETYVRQATWQRSVYSSVTNILYAEDPESLDPDRLYGVKVDGDVIAEYVPEGGDVVAASEELQQTAETEGVNPDLVLGGGRRYLLVNLWRPIGTTTNGWVTLYSFVGEGVADDLLATDPRSLDLFIYRRSGS
ncbi:MAG: hypothetical protein AVDCRST_MAG19-341 [uncultured Thermomicrobiales bacterium]|uniref:Uncharacterized protein n=1 Tax=uncultured Thermomicrobiales bacterium TaxID=1645740 RepID=A0A6J4UCK0_9BACT|nr:MAG: hypothetical protein AVDCRST_MAG19-341 [uncultured Thermomicrobiales bacterium]